MIKKIYLGDGIYWEDTGDMITLSTQRESQKHFVCLENDVLLNFIKTLQLSRNVSIKITRNDPLGESEDG